MAEADLTNKGLLSRSSHPEVLCKKRAPQYLAKFTGMLDKFETLFKKILLHRCSPVNLFKLFRATFYRTLSPTANDLSNYLKARAIKNFDHHY